MIEPSTANRVLVIRLGALGDLVQSFPLFAAIRAMHPRARITLLTTTPFAAWMQRAPWFDHVLVDPRRSLLNPASLLSLRRSLRGYDFVYDLQTSARSTRYWWIAGCPPWCGIGRWRSHRHRNPHRDLQHSWNRQRDQLAYAGINHVPVLPPSSLAPLIDPPPLTLADRCIVLVPGAAPLRPEKCWPSDSYGQLAARLVASDYCVVIAGSVADQPAAIRILQAAPACRDLTGHTSLPQLAGLLAGACLVVGNDTGPMHLAAALDATCLVLFGAASNPALTAPRNSNGMPATVLAASDLARLPVADVQAAIVTLRPCQPASRPA